MLPVQNQSQTEMGVSERSRVLDHGVQPRLQGKLDTAGDRNLAAEPGKGVLVTRPEWLRVRQNGNLALPHGVSIDLPVAIAAGAHDARVHRNGNPQAGSTDGA